MTKNFQKGPQLCSGTQFRGCEKPKPKELALRNSQEKKKKDDQLIFFSKVLKLAHLHQSYFKNVYYFSHF